MPVTLAKLTGGPEEYYDRSVTVDSVVGETVEPNAFVLADEAALEDDVLERRGERAGGQRPRPLRT